MRSGRNRKAPLYVLPHGIEVIGEYAARGVNRYWRVRIRPHPFFPDVAVVHGGCCIRRSRVVLASKLGRALTPDELAHHCDEDRDNDSPGNVQLVSASEHNRHHKIGSVHSEEAKSKISEGLRRAIKEGRRQPPPPPDWLGRKHSTESRQRISASRKEAIAAGRIPKPIPPPSVKGRKLSETTKQKMREAKLAYWQQKKEQTS